MWRICLNLLNGSENWSEFVAVIHSRLCGSETDGPVGGLGLLKYVPGLVEPGLDEQRGTGD